MRKLTVIIADDDRYVIKDLTKMIDWAKYGFRIVGTAESGEEALLLIDKFHPNLLITDIRMKGMNGLDVIDQVINKYPEMKYIIISSYNDFEYARRALQNNVADFLIKTELSPAKLINTLEKLRLTMQKEASYSYVTRIAEMDHFFQHRESSILDYETLRSIENQDYFFVAITKSRVFSNDSDSDTAYLSEVQNTTWSVLQEFCGYPIVFIQDRYVIAGLDTETLGTSLLTNLHNFFHTLTFRLMNTSMPYLFFSEDRSMNLNMYRSIFFNMKETMNFYSFFNYERTLFNTEKFHGISVLPVSQPFPFQKLIMDEEHMEEDIMAIREYLSACIKSYNIEAIDHFYKDYCAYIRILTNSQLALSSVVNAPQPEYFQKWVFNTLFDCIQLLTHGTKFSYNHYVDEAISFIKQNYSDSDLSVIDIAAHVDLSANRLGVLFKKDTGKTVNEYVNKVRVEKSIELLEKTNLKIYEISEKCGYKSSQYFSQIILQKTGKRPIDFRRVKK